MIKQIAKIAASQAMNKRMIKASSNGKTASDVEYAIYQAEQRRKTKSNILKGVVGVAAGYALYKFGKNIIKNQTDKDQSPDVQYAKRLRTAMSPSGVWWIPDGTDEKGLFKVAYEIAANPEVSFRQVQNSYKKLYNKNLSEHLEGELSTSEYTKFLNIVGENYNPETDKDNPSYFGSGKMIIMTEKTPMFKEQGDYFSTETMPANSFFINAQTTGKEKTFVDMITGGAVFKQKRIQIKKVQDSKTRWLDAEGIITKAFTKENMLDYKNKGYKAYKLS